MQPSEWRIFFFRSCKARISLRRKQERQQGEQHQLWIYDGPLNKNGGSSCLEDTMRIFCRTNFELE